MVVTGRFYLGLGCIVAGIIIALFPSNYEIVGMDDLAIGGEDGESEEE
jgi:hypothetical protein